MLDLILNHTYVASLLELGVSPDDILSASDCQTYLSGDVGMFAELSPIETALSALLEASDALSPSGALPALSPLNFSQPLLAPFQTGLLNPIPDFNLWAPIDTSAAALLPQYLLQPGMSELAKPPRRHSSTAKQSSAFAQPQPRPSREKRVSLPAEMPSGKQAQGQGGPWKALDGAAGLPLPQLQPSGNGTRLAPAPAPHPSSFPPPPPPPRPQQDLGIVDEYWESPDLAAGLPPPDRASTLRPFTKVFLGADVWVPRFLDPRPEDGPKQLTSL